MGEGNIVVNEIDNNFQEQRQYEINYINTDIRVIAQAVSMVNFEVLVEIELTVLVTVLKQEDTIDGIAYRAFGMSFNLKNMNIKLKTCMFTVPKFIRSNIEERIKSNPMFKKVNIHLQNNKFKSFGSCNMNVENSNFQGGWTLKSAMDQISSNKNKKKLQHNCYPYPGAETTNDVTSDLSTDTQSSTSTETVPEIPCEVVQPKENYSVQVETQEMVLIPKRESISSRVKKTFSAKINKS